MSAISLAVAKDHLGITGGESDAELQRFIDRAEAMIGHWTGPLAPTSTTKHLPGGSSLFLPGPVVSLTSIVPVLPGGTPLDLSGFDVDTVTGQITNYGSLPLWADRYVVTYLRGWTTVPADLVYGALELVRHLWGTQRGGQRKPGSTASPVAPYALPNFVATIIEPYLQAGVA